MILRAPFSKPKSHEDLFVGHYEFLAQRALQITQGDREAAEDLVHDLYVQWVRVRPDLEFDDDERVRGYLFIMMRNLSVSKARRAGSDALSSLLVIDYESAEFAFASFDRSKLAQVRSALARTCEYTCTRMHTSRSASVLALRFFLGYYPSEIVRILQTTPMAVDKHLQAARLEARAYLQRPGTLRFLGQEIKLASISTANLPDDPIALFTELRGRIFAGVKGECLSASAIQERYAPHFQILDISEGRPTGPQDVNRNEQAPYSIAELAHVASCAACLESVSLALGIDGLSERCSSDSFNRKGGGDDPPQSSGDGLDPRVLKKKNRQTYEHSPTKLQFAVDGEIRVAHRIAAARNELQVKLDPLTKPAFLEVISEQGVRLVYLHIEESQLVNLEPCISSNELSNGRFVELSLSFESGTLIATALYYDPLQEEQLDSNPIPFLSAKGVEILASPANSQPSLRRAARALARSIHSCFPSLDSLWPLGLATALGGILLAGAFLWFKHSSAPISPTATALLTKARRLEEAKMAGGAAIHSTFSLETRSTDGKILATQTIDSWRSTQPRRSALRLLDDNGRVVAGEWKDAKRGLTSYPKKKARGAESANARIGSATNFEDPWHTIAEGVANSSISQLQTQLNVGEEKDGYDLHFDAGSNNNAPGLVKADWVLNAASGESVRGSLLVRENGDVHEYRFRELTYEVVSPAAIMEQDFTEDVGLRASRAALIPMSAGANSAHVTLEVLKLFNAISPAIGELLEVKRRDDGVVEITGVLPSKEAVATVQQITHPLLASKRLAINLHWRDEPPVASQQTTSFAITSVPVSLDHAKIPFDAELRSSLVSVGLSGDELEAGILNAAQEGISHGTRMRRAAYQLYQIASVDVSADELRSLSTADRATWLGLLNIQATTVLNELARVRQTLSMRVPDSEMASSQNAPSGFVQIDSPERLALATEQLDIDCKRIATLLTDNLAISSSGIPQQSNKIELKELLWRSQILGTRISHTLAALSNN